MFSLTFPRRSGAPRLRGDETSGAPRLRGDETSGAEPSFWSWLAIVVTLLAAILVPRVARADQSTAHTVSVAVLGFDSDDAEEQADALTGALRSRVRASQGELRPRSVRGLDHARPLPLLICARRPE